MIDKAKLDHFLLGFKNVYQSCSFYALNIGENSGFNFFMPVKRLEASLWLEIIQSEIYNSPCRWANWQLRASRK